MGTSSHTFSFSIWLSLSGNCFICLLEILWWGHMELWVSVIKKQMKDDAIGAWLISLYLVKPWPPLQVWSVAMVKPLECLNINSKYCNHGRHRWIHQIMIVKYKLAGDSLASLLMYWASLLFISLSLFLSPSLSVTFYLSTHFCFLNVSLQNVVLYMILSESSVICFFTVLPYVVMCVILSCMLFSSHKHADLYGLWLMPMKSLLIVFTLWGYLLMTLS